MTDKSSDLDGDPVVKSARRFQMQRRNAMVSRTTQAMRAGCCLAPGAPDAAWQPAAG